MAKDKRQFEHESLEDSRSVVEYLKAVTEGLSNGGVRFRDKEGEFTLQMDGLVDFEIRATRKRNKAQLTLKITSKDRDKAGDSSAGPLEIDTAEG